MPPRSPGPGDARYGAYALAVLITAYVLAFIDRQLLSLLTEPIKRDLGLSDVQIGLLQGFGFALFLSLAGLPIGRLIDTRRRVSVLWIGVTVWSLMTAACGAAAGFPALLACRLGVGAGESGMTPAAYSLLGDYLPGRRLGLAVSLYGMGAYVGSGLALLLGALVLSRLPPSGVALMGVGATAPWRVAFLAAGAVGIVVALWTASLREPHRAGSNPHALPLADVLAYFRTNGWAVAGVHLSIAFSAMAFSALTAWAPAWFARSFHQPIGQIGRSLGLEVILMGVSGALLGGIAGDRLRARGLSDGRLLLVAVAALLAAPVALVAPLAPTASMALWRLAPLILLLTMVIATGPAILQEITPNRARGVQHAIAVLTVNLIGLGLGPLLIALFTDHVLKDEKHLALALARLLPVMLVASAAIAAATLRPYRHSRARIDL